LCLLGRCSTTWAMHLALFVLSYFSNRVLWFCLVWSPDYNLPAYISHIPGTTHMHHHNQIICWAGCPLTFCPDCPPTTVLPISASQVARITSMSHHAKPGHNRFLCINFVFSNVAEISSSNIFVDVKLLQFQDTGSLHPWTEIVFLLFQFGCLLSLFLAYLPARTSNSLWNRSGMPVLFFTLEEKLGFSLLRISVMAFYIAFICEGPPG
jgi:hypothetical protein